MRLADSRKADISLSINAIVIIVIAFVVLGLALTLTRTIFKGALGKIPEALDLTQLESQPTAENPLSIPDTINIKTGDSVTLSMGYYNRWSDTIGSTTAPVWGAKIGIIKCKEEGGTTKHPTVLSPQQIIPASEAKGYKIILTAYEAGSTTAKIDAGTYVCRVIAYKSTVTTQASIIALGDPCSPSRPSPVCEIFEDKQIFLKVTS